MIDQTKDTDTEIVTGILNKAEQKADISVAEAIKLIEQQDQNLRSAIALTADKLRQKQVGNIVTYVINRNINFTNICEQHCSFCAFRRDANETGSFWLDIEQIISKAAEAVKIGATEICMQGGLNPQAKVEGTSLNYYLNLIKEIKSHFPQLHLHAFSPKKFSLLREKIILAMNKYY